MSKGQQTQKRIIEAASILINQKGVNGMSMRDLMVETGLEKGGIYRHYSSKSDIVAEVVKQYIRSLATRVNHNLTKEKTAKTRVNLIIDSLASVAWDPIVQGGCLLMTISAESSDNEAQETIRQSFNMLTELIQAELTTAIENEELSTTLNPKIFSSVVISAIEGSVLLSETDGNPEHARNAASFLKNSLDFHSTQTL